MIFERVNLQFKNSKVIREGTYRISYRFGSVVLMYQVKILEVIKKFSNKFIQFLKKLN